MEGNQNITQNEAVTKDQTKIAFYVTILIAGCIVTGLAIATLI